MGAVLILPGTQKTPKAPITVTPAGLSYTAELFVSPDGTTKTATSGPLSQTSTGAVQTVSLPITLPQTPGSYGVYLDVISSGQTLGAFVGTDTVVIPGATIGSITWG